MESSPEGLVIGPDGTVARVAPEPAVNCGQGDNRRSTGHSLATRLVDNTGYMTCQFPLALTLEPPIDMGDSIMTRGRAERQHFGVPACHGQHLAVRGPRQRVEALVGKGAQQPA